MIRSRSGWLKLHGSMELCVQNVAKQLQISVEDLLERIETPTERQAKRDLMNKGETAL